MPKHDTVIGTWYVHITDAPFKYHLFTFHADGTLLQANPDAGDSATSDSIGMGPWQASGNHIHAKFVETTADRHTHAFVARGEVLLTLQLHGDSFTGTAEATFYDTHDQPLQASSSHAVHGQRITL